LRAKILKKPSGGADDGGGGSSSAASVGAEATSSASRMVLVASTHLFWDPRHAVGGLYKLNPVVTHS
jgi:hypothetical protein